MYTCRIQTQHHKTNFALFNKGDKDREVSEIPQTKMGALKTTGYQSCHFCELLKIQARSYSYSLSCFYKAMKKMNSGLHIFNKPHKKIHLKFNEGLQTLRSVRKSPPHSATPAATSLVYLAECIKHKELIYRILSLHYASKPKDNKYFKFQYIWGRKYRFEIQIW